MKRASSSTTLAFLMLLIFGTFASAGPGQPVAVVSTLSGDVTVARAGRSIPLKFKDETLPDDVIRTADQSVVRLLLREKALMTVQQRSVLTLGEEQGNLTVKLETGKIGVSVADRRLRPGEALRIETPNVQAALGRGNVIVNTGKISSGVQTIVYVVDGSVEISLRSTATRRSVKIEAPRKLTVVGKALGNTQALSAAESTKLLAELRATSPQHLNAPPPEIERVIVRQGRAEAAKQAKLVAKQVKQAGGLSQGSESSRNSPQPETGTSFDTGKGTGTERGSKTEPGSSGKEGGGSGSPPSQGPTTQGTTSQGAVSGPYSTLGSRVGVKPGGGGPSQTDAVRMQRALPPGAAQQVTRPQAPTQLPAHQVAPKSAQ